MSPIKAPYIPRNDLHFLLLENFLMVLWLLSARFLLVSSCKSWLDFFLPSCLGVIPTSALTLLLVVAGDRGVISKLVLLFLFRHAPNCLGCQESNCQSILPNERLGQERNCWWVEGVFPLIPWEKIEPSSGLRLSPKGEARNPWA